MHGSILSAIIAAGLPFLSVALAVESPDCDSGAHRFMCMSTEGAVVHEATLTITSTDMGCSRDISPWAECSQSELTEACDPSGGGEPCYVEFAGN